MKAFLTAAVLLAGPMPAAAQAPLGSDAGFALDLGRIGLELRPGFEGLDRSLRLGQPRTHEEAVQAVLAKLQGSGVPESFVRVAFDDPATRIIPEIPDRFGKPGEALPYERYRRIFITPERIAAGKAFLRERAAVLGRVEAAQRVEGSLLAAFAGIETFYGTRTGTMPVFSALYTIILKVPSRSSWAVGELAAYLRLCRAEGWSVHATKGSYAGAFGFTQFIPSTFERAFVDFDGDGRRAFDSWDDALGSTSNLLTVSGYKPGTGYAQGSPNWWAIYAYNHSDNYVRVILELRDELLKP